MTDPAPAPPPASRTPSPPPGRRRRPPLFRPRDERDPGSWPFALVAWLVIVGLSGLLIALNVLAEAPAVETAAVPPPAPMLEPAAKIAVVAKTPAERTQAAGVLGWFTAAPADQLRVAIVQADLGEAEQATASLDEVAAQAEGQLAADTAAVRAAIQGGPDALTPEQRQGLLDRHGWFGRLLMSRGQGEDEPDRAAVLAEARRSFVVQTVFSLSLLGVMVLSGVLFILAVVLVATGVIRARLVPPKPGGTVYLETFAVFLIFLIGVEVLASLLQPVMGSSAFLLRWLCLLAVLWPVARGQTLRRTRQRLGWTWGANPVLEVILGVVGYIALLPIVAVGLGCTALMMFVWGRISGGEEAAAPTHPLPEMLAGANPWDLAMIVVLATVWAPVVEETFFRGALFHHLRGRLDVVTSGLVSAFVFAALHPQGVFGIPALMSIALCMSLLREWRGTIWASVAAHAANNGFITLMLVFLLSS